MEIQKLMLGLAFLNCQVKVADRTAIVTTNAETVVVSPPGLQEAINEETGIFFSIPSFQFVRHVCLNYQCVLPTFTLIQQVSKINEKKNVVT